MGTILPPPNMASALFGQTQREVLALLLGRPNERFYFREILRTVGGGSGAVQRELSRLVEGGLAERKREGRQVYFSANRDAAIFPELHGIIQKTVGAAAVLRASLADLLRDDRLSVAFVYGSVARNEQGAQSDVDVMFLGDVLLADVIPAIRVAEQKLGREINPSVYPIKEYRAKLKRGAPFLKRVLAGPKVFIKGDEGDLARLGGSS